MRLEAVRTRQRYERPLDRRRVLVNALERLMLPSGRPVLPVDLERLTLDQIETRCGWLVAAARR